MPTRLLPARLILPTVVLSATAVFAGEPAPPQKCFEDSEVIIDSGVVDAITADVDGDGREDLLALQPLMLNILRNDGENFVPFQSIKVGAAITKIAAGHINDDDAPDIAILRGDELVIYINAGARSGILTATARSMWPGCALIRTGPRFDTLHASTAPAS